ncbi:uncharacterized protein LOC106804208 [Setaria italica]|uniref:uncharacterized protein LOC106804208 n=1 Tax=Setaria italica TaxID=4555 RepID=UPI000719A074|nr:uncharacterized protein LOC106804208 [Setaria italica]
MASEDKIEHEKLAQRSANYVIIEKELYRKATSRGILMKCIMRSEVVHPRCNGQIECANRMVFKFLKSHIFDDASKYATKWLRELHHVIWGLWTQKSWATGYTPFFMVYGLEAILPSNMAFGTPCIQYYEEGKAETSRQVDIGSLE